MTKTELQAELAAATETDKRTAGVFLETLSALAYKETKKTSVFVLPGFGKLVKQKRKARTGFNPKTQQKIKIPASVALRWKDSLLNGLFLGIRDTIPLMKASQIMSPIHS
jgi:DNA-binding protein HU-beta